jgi:hypothetical protein
MAAPFVSVTSPLIPAVPSWANTIATEEKRRAGNKVAVKSFGENICHPPFKVVTISEAGPKAGDTSGRCLRDEQSLHLLN